MQLRKGNIQIWTCDEGNNMEFYGSEVTILTEAKPRSILLPKFHKTHIAQHHRSIFDLLYVKCFWFKHLSMDTYIAKFSLIIYYHSLFYSLEYGATIVISYCDFKHHASNWLTFLSSQHCILNQCAPLLYHVTMNQPISFDSLHLTYKKNTIYLYPTL